MRERGKSDGAQLVPIAGRMIEGLLIEARYSLRLAVPAKPNEQYTLGDIWPKLLHDGCKRFKNMPSEAKGALRALGDTVIMRNWLTHAGEWAKDFSQEECLGFIDACLSVCNHMHCPTCGGLLEAVDTPPDYVSCRRGCFLTSKQ